MASQRGRPWSRVLSLTVLVLALAATAHGSAGDRLPGFKDCLKVCKTENCGSGKDYTAIPFHHRLLLWDCASECNYACQHIITGRRIEYGAEVVQFYGKWPFYRFLGMQEPFSVLFSLGNLWAHWEGLKKVRTKIPASYSLRPFYIWLGYVGLVSWIASSIFHTRDFRITEEFDYFAAGANVLYGLYYTPIRVFRLDRSTPRRQSVLRAWTLLCIFLYFCHVSYLKFVRWNYTYNMTANVVVGAIQHSLWTWFSFDRYRKSKRVWAAWPGLVVAWIILAMSMELLDFPPWLGCIDAHSLWHLMTIGPTIVWYNFLVKDAREDIAGSQRLKS
ncbi:Per1-like-domain-containing protein [Ilyonectria robusta]|uniref:Per1-like-domain-containing protein n=1 Tax=Ilyonectria robusta TaxID=1079257 RepID=UPI001E8E2B93|nr:Per1-like-domain-containing protein [Ilyonectria robusta]KAH8736917.1 Per1-like-domain-containing protein [Ilyonectria robusta]